MAQQLDPVRTRDMEENKEPRSALIAGATGLVGGFLLDRLLQEDLYREVKALVRRPLERQDRKLSTAVVDFDQLADSTDAPRVDDVFCCLGTTIKKAGSKAAFRKVDQDYVAALAHLTRAAGARRFLLVSSIGADPAAGNFYLSVKGAAEEAVRACGFPELHVFRPAQLLGPRQEDRPGERLAIVAARLVTPFLLGGWRRFRPVQARPSPWRWSRQRGPGKLGYRSVPSTKSSDSPSSGDTLSDTRTASLRC